LPIFDFVTRLSIFARSIFNRQSEIGNRNGVADGTRTRNNQNHNLELYH
jgi:hypothetical protein